MAQLHLHTVDSFSPPPAARGLARAVKACFVTGQNIYEVVSRPRAAVAPHHRPGGLEHQKFMFLVLEAWEFHKSAIKHRRGHSPSETCRETLPASSQFLVVTGNL